MPQVGWGKMLAMHPGLGSLVLTAMTAIVGATILGVLLEGGAVTWFMIKGYQDTIAQESLL